MVLRNEDQNLAIENCRLRRGGSISKICDMGIRVNLKSASVSTIVRDGLVAYVQIEY